jgi:hypothetical protein
VVEVLGVDLDPHHQRSLVTSGSTTRNDSWNPDTCISIHRRYKALPGRDGAETWIQTFIPLIGPGLCRILQVNFPEHVFHAVG